MLVLLKEETTMRQLLVLLLSLLLVPQVPVQGNETIQTLIDAERDRCGEIIDMHIHPISPGDSSPENELNEMDKAGVSRSVVYSVYSANSTRPDSNTLVRALVKASNGRMYGLASLDTTGDWETDRVKELGRLKDALAQAEFVGTKLAPPHTCLALDGNILPEIIQAISESSKPTVAIHVGTTPFCGPFGEMILGYRGCCQSQYVDPSFLEGLVSGYANVTFVLLHSGFDFLPPTDEYFYNGTNVQNAIALAKTHDNVILEVSALHPGTMRNPTGSLVVQQIKNAGLANRMVWGSDTTIPGTMSTSLAWIVPAMIDAGYTTEERCSALVGLSKRVFNLPDASAPAEPILLIEKEPGADDVPGGVQGGACWGVFLVAVVAALFF